MQRAICGAHLRAYQEGGGDALVKRDEGGKNTPRRGTRPGSIRQVRLRLWWAIQEASELLDEDDNETRLKAISALSTACGAYGNLTKVHALEAELEAIRKEFHDLRASLGRPAGAATGSGAAAPN